MSKRLSRLRRPLAALFAAAATGSALTALRPGPAPSVRVLAASHDLPGGAVLAPPDLHGLDLPPAAVPAGALRSGAAGHVLAGPMRRGEPVTDARLLGDGLLHGYGPETVAAPVRLADAATARLLHPGDRIDVLATGPPTAEAPLETGPGPPPRPEARLVAAAIPVLTIPSRDETSGQDGALIVVAATRPQATALAAAGPALAMTITS
ncbi:RcpC/CpaB family pilus assembly protein [Actinomadura roseirufa]|uniref:RcpC/CpaB family pilus assembly protein n=1 Tax=Actinomadura roseirufa TaxID=2094049 RepID=UPI0010411B72|nr:RcpC/CpaB family pilus assembly protein [Actinomadura roseirufa]